VSSCHRCGLRAEDAPRVSRSLLLAAAAAAAAAAPAGAALRLLVVSRPVGYDGLPPPPRVDGKAPQGNQRVNTAGLGANCWATYDALFLIERHRAS